MTLRNRRIVGITVVAVATLLVAALAVAKTTFTPVATTAVQIAPATGGELNCIGGTATGTWPPCSPGSKSQIRGSNVISRLTSHKPDGTPDPLNTGTRFLVFNATLDENGNGHVWGTWRFVLDSGLGEWEGTYTGFAHGWFGASNADVVGHGTAGQVDGMELRLVSSYETFPVDPKTGLPGVETDTGYRFDPGGK